MKIFKRVALTTLIFLTTAVLSIAYFIRSPVIGQYAFKENIIRSDQKSLLQHVRFLSELNPVRNYQEHDSIEAAKKYIASEFSEYGYEVEMQDIHSKENSFYNVIARYGEGQGPLVVVGAHYDVAGEGNPGADDNASGVAGLLEIARMLQANKPKFEFPVELVAYTLEEPPFFAGDGMGSAFHAKALNEQGKSVKLMYSLEMIGYFSEEMFSQLYPVPLLFLIYPWVGDFIAIVGGMQDRKLLKNLKKSFNG